MPTEAGELLRNARTGLGIELAEVHDRTGISWRNLEALESGDVQRFSDPAAAAVAMRRYAELVSLDPDPLVRAVTAPTFALAGAPSPGANGSWAAAPGEAEMSGHLRQYYGDHSHLRSFTQTAQVPAVGGWTSGPTTGTVHSGGPAGGYRAARRRRKVPWLLRFLIWFVLFLVVVGAAGLSINHLQPQWLRDIHVLKSNPQQATPPTSSSPSQTTRPTSPGTTHPIASLVTTSRIATGTAAVKVGVSHYTVVVGAFNSCWVEARTPGSVNPIINQTLTPGQIVRIPVTGGQLSLELGAAAAGISVEIGGIAVPGWSLRPNTVPFIANFTDN